MGFAQGKKSCKINYTKEGYVKALIIEYKVDGCGFLLQLHDKEKTKLSAPLSDEFKKDRRKVWIKYSPVKKAPPSGCMAGKPVELLDIKKR